MADAQGLPHELRLPYWQHSGGCYSHVRHLIYVLPLLPDYLYRRTMAGNGHRGSATAPSSRGRQGYIAGGAVRNEKRVGDNQQEDFKRAESKDGSRNGDLTGAGREEVDGMRALNSPIRPTNAGSIGVGVRLSESRHHHRRLRGGYVHLRRLFRLMAPAVRVPSD